MNLTDPFSPEFRLVGSLASNRDCDRAAYALAERVFEKNAAAGRENYIVRAIHRGNGESRLFNLDPKSPGGMSMAQRCLDGTWRIASEEEAVECQRKEEEARLAELKRRSDISGIAAALSNQAIFQMAAQAAIASNVPAPAETKVEAKATKKDSK